MNDAFDQAEALQNLLIAHATGGRESNQDYAKLRSSLMSNSSVESLTPRFVRNCRNLDQFWQFIKFERSSYAERRQLIWDAFRPILETLERASISPADHIFADKLSTVDASHVQSSWKKALERRASDPEGAITSARTLIESVCKHILDESGTEYDDGAELPKLYKTTAETLNLAPSQHTEAVFKQVLGGCTSVVEGLGSLRNRLSDAHGKGKVGSKPAPRHAELAVNLSGALATFLLATWEARPQESNE
ncbi:MULTISPECIES: abortive infection family protein [unclassified Stenotrophomonas]|uniref:abortive infection family protein n=1 Tax=unclassified Stenotrophomonas TaxID=196198 RepID=UPI002447C99D|nr:MULTISPECIES: abortive infection family protein [unclassified Stenotrophomonas]MBN5161007.1 abortive infection family protein [Stenotrophomonas maltophilia]MDG9845159.1 abortive infection family protein [Stenotrophomonas sp. GD04054]MDH0017299.1 abortive infection family protein [Stenotrophomonas sp. GD04028]MDH0577066.1 abortive infection family protein [Stenotrophomonas sp. GD03997]MDH0860414.1 abortive infection family protein [Stenotrophomonas sp. GD03882]